MFQKVMGSEGSEVSEGFQRGLKLSGFQGVSEGSETVVSCGFKSGLKPSVVSQSS